MYLSKIQIAASLQKLQDVHPFFGMSFLAFKLHRLPVGESEHVNFSAVIEGFLREYYRPDTNYGGYYNPFKTSDPSMRWTASRYPSTSVQRFTVDTFGSAFIHKKGTSDWGWRQGYVTELKKHLGDTKIPAVDLAVWVFRKNNWQKPKLADVLKFLIRKFVITDQESKELFDTTVRESASVDAFSPRAVIESELLELLGPSPSARPESGAALRRLELVDVGPTKHFLYQPAERLNLVTGDNSLGKTFLFECIWWALTGRWCDLAALPRQNAPKQTPAIKWSISLKGNRTSERASSYDWEKRLWKLGKKDGPIAGLVIYARFDGSFAIWDPARVALSENLPDGRGLLSGDLNLSARELWDGRSEKDTSGIEHWLCNGLIRDWVTWQTSDRSGDRFDLLATCLSALSPSPDEKLMPGDPTRFTLDSRDMPTLRMPYGDVPLRIASAGIQRAVALAYILVWTWHEHLANCAMNRSDPQRRLIFLIDEVEAHLHPRWQRTIVPSLLEVIGKVAEDIAPQLHVATHSPMVMASSEPCFSDETDALHHLSLKGDDVILQPVDFVKRGRADLWLMSDVFGLAQARSLPAETAIEEAKELQSTKSPAAEKVKSVHDQLCRLLAPDDEFWPRWLYFAEQHGVET
jgi:hypothetical protein